MLSIGVHAATESDVSGFMTYIDPSTTLLSMGVSNSRDQMNAGTKLLISGSVFHVNRAVFLTGVVGG